MLRATWNACNTRTCYRDMAVSAQVKVHPVACRGGHQTSLNKARLVASIRQRDRYFYSEPPGDSHAVICALDNVARPLGRSGVLFSTVGFGAWAIGGTQKAGCSAQTDVQSVAALRRSIDLGCNWIDTAPIYGLGHSEDLVGRALAGIDRSTVLVATKCGREMQPSGVIRANLRPTRMRQELDLSLLRLGTDYIDLYMIHWPDVETGTPLDESWATMAELKAEGKVRMIGVCNFALELVQQCEAVAHVDAIQVGYNFLWRGAAKTLFPWCAMHGCGTLVHSPMASGLLSGSIDLTAMPRDDFRWRLPHFRESELSGALSLVEALRPIAQRHALTVGQLAIAWILSNHSVTATTVGARSTRQVEDNSAARMVDLTTVDLDDVEAVLNEHYPREIQI